MYAWNGIAWAGRMKKKLGKCFIADFQRRCRMEEPRQGNEERATKSKTWIGRKLSRKRPAKGGGGWEKRRRSFSGLSGGGGQKSFRETRPDSTTRTKEDWLTKKKITCACTAVYKWLTEWVRHEKTPKNALRTMQQHRLKIIITSYHKRNVL